MPLDGQFIAAAVQFINLGNQIFVHIINDRKQALSRQSLPIQHPGFLQQVMNNLAALFIGQISLILLVDGLIINRTHIQQVPGNFEFGLDAGLVIGIQILSLIHI